MSDTVTGDNGHTYPSKYAPPTGNAEMDEAWGILDAVKPGIIPVEIRAFLAGMITGVLMRYKREVVKDDKEVSA